MKTKLILIAILLWSTLTNAQVYQTNKNLTLAQINAVNRAHLSPSTIAATFAAVPVISNVNITKNTLFQKVDEIGDYYILEVLPFSNNVPQNQQLYNTGYAVGAPVYNADLFYIVIKSKLSSDFEENKSRLGFGTVLLPVKIRFGDERDGTKLYTKFESGINLGVALTWRFRRKLHEVDTYGLLSFSSSQVSLDAENTNNYISTSQSELAMTPSTGILFQFKNKLQIILITGIDVVSGKIGREWIYRDKPFLGLGLGFNIAELGKKPGEN